MKTLSIKKSLLLIFVFLTLGGCVKDQGNPPQSEDVSNEDGLMLVSWDDRGPIDYKDMEDWTKFSFSDFSVKMPRNFRVVNLAENQKYVELVNYAEVEDESIGNGDLGKLKMKVSLLDPDVEFDSLMEGKDVQRTVNIAGQKANVISGDDGGSLVLVRSQSQGRVYEFEFMGEFSSFDNLESLILSSVAFYQRDSL